MITATARKDCGRHARWALSLAEAVISIAIIGVMLVAALNTVGASQTTQKKMSDRSRGVLLAQDLMSEILQQHYEDPGLSAGSFGLAGAKIGDGSRTLWDDVDDYDGWSASPPQEKDGTEITGFDGWRRSVAVEWVDQLDVAAERGSDTGVKRITVSVTLDDAPLATLVALRTNAFQYGPEEE